MEEKTSMIPDNIESKYLNSLTIWYITIFFMVNRRGDLLTIWLDGTLDPTVLGVDKAIVFSAFKYFMAPLIGAFIIAEVQKLFTNQNKDYWLNKLIITMGNSPFTNNGLIRILGIAIAVGIILWTGITVMENDLAKGQGDKSIAEQAVNNLDNLR